MQEQYLAIKLETYMSKDDILENYLNTINLGNGYYGVQAAANGYFGKDVSELTLSDCFHYTESDQVKPVKVSGRQSGTTAEGFAQYAQARLHYTGRV